MHFPPINPLPALAAMLILATAGQAAEGGSDFNAKAAEAVKKAKATIAENGLQAGLKEYEEAAIALRAEFPNRAEPWAMLLEVAINLDFQDEKLQPKATMPGPDDAPIKVIDHVRSLLADISKASAANATTKERARNETTRLDRIGKPMTLEFDALILDEKSGLVRNEPFSVAGHKGKVVLIHFWSTQSGPCIADLPRITKARAGHGEDIVLAGISLDTNQARLRRYLKENKIDWPQHFDGRGWDNKFAIDFGVTSIPAQWLIDRNGNLRDTNGRHNLEAKLKVLTAEKISEPEDSPPDAPETSEGE
ncbi:MAG: hypothetical protein CMO74_01610 [Verrucomicrobiales bacterium]|nr:hypothetical protein [Verrucomicrobiales bacterium]|tara:strand:- start:1078 stop:1998 length:921 start_codon:yes stop_codon:yes gene_type:complete